MSAKSKEAVKDNLIQREQLELVKTERDILAMLQQIDQQINRLIVEELQLKSNEVANLTADTKFTKHNDRHLAACNASSDMKYHSLRSQTAPADYTISHLDNDAVNIDSTELINQQYLDLDYDNVPAGYTITAFDTDEEELDE